ITGGRSRGSDGAHQPRDYTDAGLKLEVGSSRQVYRGGFIYTAGNEPASQLHKLAALGHYSSPLPRGTIRTPVKTVPHHWAELQLLLESFPTVYSLRATFAPTYAVSPPSAARLASLFHEIKSTPSVQHCLFRTARSAARPADFSSSESAS